MRRLLIVIWIVLCAPLIAEKEDESKLAYESGIAYSMAGDAAKAKAQYEKAASVKGDFSDLARVELLRLQARDGKTLIAPLTQMLSQIKDQTLQEQAYLALAGSLKESRRYQDSIDVCMLLVGRMPESELADDALLLSARIFFDLGQFDSARSQAEQIVARYKKSNSLDSARLLLAELYLIHDANYSPALACKFYASAARDSQAILTPVDSNLSRICSER